MSSKIAMETEHNGNATISLKEKAIKLKRAINLEKKGIFTKDGSSQ